MTKVRQFLGLVSYYSHFVPGFAQIAAPLHVLTKKNALVLLDFRSRVCISKSKELLTTALVLFYPVIEPEYEFILKTDGSGVELGAVLAQKQKDGSINPIAHASRTRDSHKLNYGISESELLALV